MYHRSPILKKLIDSRLPRLCPRSLNNHLSHNCSCSPVRLILRPFAEALGRPAQSYAWPPGYGAFAGLAWRFGTVDHWSALPSDGSPTPAGLGTMRFDQAVLRLGEGEIFGP